MVAFFLARPRLSAVFAAIPVSMGCVYYNSTGNHCSADTSDVPQKDWKGAWEKGMTGWHIQRTHPMLKKFFGVWMAEFGPCRKILVPLAGKTVDIPFLAYANHDVVGVELVEQAVHELAEEHDLQLTKMPEPLPGKDGPLNVFTGPYGKDGSITMLQGNFFDLSSDYVGHFDRVWDRASLVAIPPSSREQYAAVMADVVPPDGRILLTTLSYDQSLVQGPPFSVPPEEVRRLFHADFVINELAEEDASDTVPPRFRKAGVTEAKEHVFLLLRADREQVEAMAEFRGLVG